MTPAYLNNAPWDLSATNRTLEERGSEQVLGLVSDRGLPVMQPLAASTNQASWPTSGDIVNMQIAVHNGTSLTRLSPLDCLEQYSTPFGDRSDIVLIVLDTNNSNNANNSMLACGRQGAIGICVQKGKHPGEWMCRQSNTFSCKSSQRTGTRAKTKRFRPSPTGTW